MSTLTAQSPVVQNFSEVWLSCQKVSPASPGFTWAQSLQACPTLCDPVCCSPPGSSVHGIFQARILAGLPFPSPRDRPNLGIKPASPVSPALAGRCFTTEPSGNWLHYVSTFPAGSLTWRVRKIFIDQNDTNCLLMVHWPWLHVHTRSLGNIIVLETRMERRRAWAGQ